MRKEPILCGVTNVLNGADSFMVPRRPENRGASRSDSLVAPNNLLTDTVFLHRLKSMKEVPQPEKAEIERFVVNTIGCGPRLRSQERTEILCTDQGR